MPGISNYHPFFEKLANSALAGWETPLRSMIEKRLDFSSHGDLPKWRAAITGLPHLEPGSVKLNQPIVTATGDLEKTGDLSRTRGLLQHLHPWRKGPFKLGGVNIDSEWRSDWKWERLENHIQDLSDRTVLDIGCGNGYHCWRMAGAGARLVMGIDPTLVYLMQFFACRHFLKDNRVWVLPLGIEDLPDPIPAFDSVFSMGVLYHRKSPIDHLLRLHSLLRPRGELILETLIVEGETMQVLVPPGRYAKMRNTWFIPSLPMLERWLQRCKYTDIQLVDASPTTTAEQRSTDWMRFESLQECLDPENASCTVEGHPAPVRAIITARR